MGLDTRAFLFYGISNNELDSVALDEVEWFEDMGLDPPDGIDLNIVGSYKHPIPVLYSEPTCQQADGDTNTVTRLDPWPPQPPSEEHIIWLYKTAQELGWPPPDWHLAVLLARG